MKKWYPGFDWLRTVFIAWVLLMHLGFAQDFCALSARRDYHHFISIVYYAGFCSAVPGFLLISCFLRAQKDPLPFKDHRAFLLGLACLYVFWVGAWLLVTKPAFETSLGGVLSLLLRGGGWAFYYFAVLLIVHVIRCLICSWSSKSLILTSVTILTLSQSVCVLLCRNGYSWERVESYWWPINFLAIPFLGTWMAREEQSVSLKNPKGKKWLMIFAFALLISCLLDWFMVPESDNLPVLPEYLRATPTLAALILMLLSFSLRSRPTWVGWLSKNSLGIFCLHVFVLGGIGKIASKLLSQPLLIDLLTLVITMISMSLAAELMRFCLSKRVV